MTSLYIDYMAYQDDQSLYKYDRPRMTVTTPKAEMAGHPYMPLTAHTTRVGCHAVVQGVHGPCWGPCVHACVYMRVCACTCVWSRWCVSVCLCVRVCLSLSLCVRACVMCVCACVSVCLRDCMPLCLHVSPWICVGLCVGGRTCVYLASSSNSFGLQTSAKAPRPLWAIRDCKR